jgi:predicted glycoside hydrolase/deacetylase ChbG (UPF0249 family)
MRSVAPIADDAGLDARTDAAILAAAKAGTISGAAVVVLGREAASFVPRARDLGLPIGLHLCLTECRARVARHRHLVDAQGTFHGGKDRLHRVGPPAPDAADEIGAEVAAQWDALSELGATPAFLNGHHHVHAVPHVARAAAPVLRSRADASTWVRRPWTPAAELPADLAHLGETAVRSAIDEAYAAQRAPDAFVGMRFARRGDGADAGSELDALPAHVPWVEWMVHPGARPGSAFTSSPAREAEAALFSSRARIEDLLGRYGAGLAPVPRFAP